MRASLSYRAGGELRLSLHPFMPPSPGVRRGGLQSVMASAERSHLSIVTKSKIDNEPPSGFGTTPRPTKFTRLAKGAVREVCAATENLLQRRAVFCTLTLPGSTPEAMKAVADWSGKMVELIGQWLRDTAPGSLVAWVWEWQNRGALHYHAMVANEDVTLLRQVERRFKDYALHLLEQLCGWSKTDVFARSSGGTWRGCLEVAKISCRPVKKSISRYMSKYLSKGNGAKGGFYPSRWWGVNHAGREAARAERKYQSVDIDDMRTAASRLAYVAGDIADAALTTFFYDSKYCAVSRTWIFYLPDGEESGIWEYAKNLLDGIARPSRPPPYPASIVYFYKDLTNYA